MTLASRARNPEHARVLRERARVLARSSAMVASHIAAAEVTVVRVGDERFGLPVEGLREVLELPTVTRLPGMPSHVLGVCQIRGALLSVVDLARWLRVQHASEARYLAVLEGPTGAIGLTIEQAEGSRSYTSDDLERSQGGLQNDGRPVLAVARDLVTILDLERVLSHPEMRVE